MVFEQFPSPVGQSWSEPAVWLWAPTMTVDAPTGPHEQSVSINAVPADVFAVLTAVESVFEACAGLTVSADEEGATVTDGRAENASPSAFSGQVRVTEREAPTSLTLVFGGEPERTVEWTLQPEAHGLDDDNRHRQLVPSVSIIPGADTSGRYSS